MQTYEVRWTEQHVVTIKAKDEQKAIDAVMEGDYPEEAESSEMVDIPEAYLVKIK